MTLPPSPGRASRGTQQFADGGSAAQHREHVARLVCIACLTVILVASIIGLTVVAIWTDRDLLPAGFLTFVGVLVLAVLGGLSLRSSRAFRLNGDRDDPPQPAAPSRSPYYRDR